MSRSYVKSGYKVPYNALKKGGPVKGPKKMAPDMDMDDASCMKKGGKIKKKMKSKKK